MNREMHSRVNNWKTSYLMLIGLLIRRRKELGISQEELAKRLKAGRRSFQRWEDGRAALSGKRLFQWAAALGVEIAPQVAQSCPENGLMPETISRIRRDLLGLKPETIGEVQAKAILQHRARIMDLAVKVRKLVRRCGQEPADDNADPAAPSRNGMHAPQEGVR